MENLVYTKYISVCEMNIRNIRPIRINANSFLQGMTL